MKLILVEKDRSSAWYRTSDGRFDILGDDLNCTGAVARAAGAGPVWSWRPAKATRTYTNDQHPFTSKPSCLADLQHEYDRAPRVKVTLGCHACGQRNRVVVGFCCKCGKCGAQLTGFLTPTLDNFGARLAAADAAMSFGRMHFPEDYIVCATCGVTYHKRDAHSCNGSTTCEQ